MLQMEQNGRVPSGSGKISHDQEETELKRGPWTVDEDLALADYVNHHGEGQWNALARCAGLNRSGKSCRLRWLNYLRPDVRRGNITLQEQLLILELHSRWGNRWSKIAKQLPGRTDNEIKNYWRTRVQKHARQLKCDVNSKEFKDALRHVWIPRLAEKIQSTGRAATLSSTTTTYQNTTNLDMGSVRFLPAMDLDPSQSYNGTAMSSDSNVTDCLSNVTVLHEGSSNDQEFHQRFDELCYGNLISPIGQFNQGLDFSSQWINGGDHVSDVLWDVDDMWFNSANSSNI